MVAVALVTAILTAFFINRSPHELPAESSESQNTTPSVDGDNSSIPDFYFPTPIDTKGDKTDDDFITTAETPIAKDDDFISTIELPRLPPTEVTPRLDENNATDAPSSDVDAKTLRDFIDQLPVKGRPFGNSGLVGSANQKDDEEVTSGRSAATDTPSNEPSPRPSLLPSDGPSLQNSMIPSDGPSLQNSAYPSDGPSLQNSMIPSDGPSLQNSVYPSDGPSLQASIFPSHDATMIPTEIASSMNFLIADFVEGLNDEATASNESSCPLTHENSTECSDVMVGNECFYGYAYTGCNWATLSCSPMIECKCESPSGSGQGKWSCKENVSPSCSLRRSPDLPALGGICDPEESLDSIVDMVAETEIDNGSASATVSVSTDFPSDSPTIWLSSECPLKPSFGECTGYVEGLHCDFEYVYKGCTWDTVQCSPAIQCDCIDGAWNCEIDVTTPCEVTVNGHPPGGVPWGEECDPDVPVVIPESVEKKSECPDAFAFGSCAHFEEDLQCDYNHAYKGCTWDEFACAPSIICKCKEESWRCAGDFENRCGAKDGISSIPEELPWGETCDPYNDEELQEILKLRPDTEAPSSQPSAKPSYAPSMTEPMGRLSDECPITFRYGKCSEEYSDSLECPYNYAYKGCSWKELSCEPTIECKCDHWLGQWECKSDFHSCAVNGVLSLPEGLPWGEGCDPMADLPSPP